MQADSRKAGAVSSRCSRSRAAEKFQQSRQAGRQQKASESRQQAGRQQRHPGSRWHPQSSCRQCRQHSSGGRNPGDSREGRAGSSSSRQALQAEFQAGKKFSRQSRVVAGAGGSAAGRQVQAQAAGGICSTPAGSRHAGRHSSARQNSRQVAAAPRRQQAEGSSSRQEPAGAGRKPTAPAGSAVIAGSSSCTQYIWCENETLQALHAGRQQHPTMQYAYSSSRF